MTNSINFSELAQSEKNQSIENEKRYQDLLRTLAGDGQKPDHAEILGICERAGRNVTMLEEDIQWRRRRDSLIEEYLKEPQYRAEIEEIKTVMRKLYSEFAKIEEKFYAEYRPYDYKIDSIKQKLHWIMIYERELLNDCRDPNLFAELKSLDSKTSGRQTVELERIIENLDARMRSVKQKLDETPILKALYAETAELRKQYKELKQQYEMYQSELSALNLQDAEIEKQRMDIQRRMILA